VTLQDVKVPGDNVLGEIGKGHKIAFNILNFARLKLGASCCGAAREALGESVRYAADRKQFGQPIASFGAIRHKIGEMITRIHAIESLVYRTAGMIQRHIDRASGTAGAEVAAFEEYACEASIAKVAASEMLDFVLDENIQIHGGNGFVRDYPAERHYRDSRVNRIFEGTNEINRLLIPGMLSRRAARGDLELDSAVADLPNELGNLGNEISNDSPLANEFRSVTACKKAALYVFDTVRRTYGTVVSDQQEILMLVADMLIDVYASESAVMRAASAASASDVRAPLHAAAVRVFVDDAPGRLVAAGRQALGAMLQGEALDNGLAGLRRLLESTPINTIALRRQLADEAAARKAYPF
jgi:alkylation response protein AidB-like acyl-CoA dehydrogenase